MRVKVIFAAGVAAGIALVVGCHQLNNAKASGECSTYQIGYFTTDQGCIIATNGSIPNLPACTLPAGWQPLSVSQYPNVDATSPPVILAQRCAP